MVNCCVIGLGLLGSRIAGELAYHGNMVKVYDSDPHRRHVLLNVLNDHILKLETEGLVEHCVAFHENISTCSVLSDAVDDVDFIFEAVPDNLEVKKALFKEITSSCSSQTIVGSNTMTLRLEAFSKDALFSERVLGIRFLYPVFTIPVVEYCTSCFTSEDVIIKTKLFFETMDKRLVFRDQKILPKHLSNEEIKSYENAQKIKVKNLKSQKRKTGNFFANNSRSSKRTPDNVDSCRDELSPTTSIFVPPKDECQKLEKCCLEDLSRKSPDESENSSDECVICNENIIDSVFFPCGHMWLCHVCAEKLKALGKPCPACRTPVKDTIIVFKP